MFWFLTGALIYFYYKDSYVKSKFVFNDNQIHNSSSYPKFLEDNKVNMHVNIDLRNHCLIYFD